MAFSKRRLVAQHAVSRGEEKIVAGHIEDKKKLIVLHGPEDCGRTVFLNRIYNNLITHHRDSKVVFYAGSFLCSFVEDVVGKLMDLICPHLPKEIGVDGLLKEISRQSATHPHFIIILDLPHSYRSIRDVVLLLNSILSSEENCYDNLSIVASSCKCKTFHLLDITKKNKNASVDVDIGLLSETESNKLLTRINPHLDAALNLRLSQERRWLPPELCIVAVMTKRRDTTELLSVITDRNLTRISALHKREDWVTIMNTLSGDQRALLCQLLAFPGHFNVDMMLKFTNFNDVELLHSLSEQGHYLVTYYPASESFHFQKFVREMLLDVISCREYFQDEHLYSDHYWYIFQRFCIIHLELLYILGRQLLHQSVEVPRHMVDMFFHTDINVNDSCSISEKAMAHMKIHRNDVVNSLEILLSSNTSFNPEYLLKLEWLLELSTCYIMQKMVMFQRVNGIYAKLLALLVGLPDSSERKKVLVAKTQVAISFFYLYHISFQTTSKESEDTLCNAIHALFYTDEHEALGTAYFKLARLKFARARTLGNLELQKESIEMYQKGYVEWERQDTDSASRAVVIAIAHRHEAAMQFNVGNYENARDMITTSVFPVYKEMGMIQHPFYASACSTYARALMNIHGCNLVEVKPYLDLSLSIRSRTLGDYHADTIMSLKGIGKYYQQANEDESAAEFLREACERAYYVLGITEQTSFMFRLYGERLRLLKRDDEADQAFDRSKLILDTFESSRNGIAGMYFPVENY